MRTDPAHELFRNPAAFSRYLLGLPLYDYQLDPLQPIIDSIFRRHGREFLLIFPRQSGKNEAVAHLLVYLLNLLQRRGGSIVYGAIGDALGRGIRRLEQRLDNPLNRAVWSKSTRPIARRLGRAQVIFLSTHPLAASRGETAHWLLVIDELQDQDPHHLEAVFEPMRAANNATALYIGTVRTTADALWLKKTELEIRQQADGRQRVWLLHPDTVIASNPNYGRFLQSKIDRFGRDHPIIASEYFNEPILGEGGLFDARRRQLMLGHHPRQFEPDPAATYLATLDVAGQDESAASPLAQLNNPARDYTVATIFQAILDDDDPLDHEGTLHYHAVDIFVDHGSRHFEDHPGRPRLAQRLLAWLQHWNVHHLIADNSGVGAGLVSWLTAKLGPGRVTGYTFTPAAKALLGSRFITCIETGRFKYWSGDDQPLDDAWYFWQQAQACTYHIPPGGQFDRHLQWSVPPAARISTPAGSEPLHDDRLISAALVAHYDQLLLDGRLNLGRAHSAIIPAHDPLEDLTWS
jgi:hypothetical protein